MKETLIIKNFGPVTDIEIELKRINIFIGEQGVGKSSVAKLYSCMQDLYLHYLILLGKEESKIMDVFKRYGIHGYFNDKTYLEFHSVKGVIVKYEQGNFEISKPDSPKADLALIIITGVLDGLMQSVKASGVSLNSAFNDLKDKDQELAASKLRTSFYLPVERSLVGSMSSSLSSLVLSGVPLPNMLLEFLSFFEKAKKEFPNYEIPFLGLTFKTSNNEDKIWVGDKEIDFKYCSSGIQSIVPMLMIIDYCLKRNFFKCFALEEPEINLFPTNQLELIRFIISKINQEKGIENLIITTHSPYILSILNVSILAGKIVGMNPHLAEDVSAVLKPEFHLQSSEIEVFSLGKKINGGKECESIFDSSTGLIKGNYLDAVSSIISADFNKLNRLYIKTLRDL